MLTARFLIPAANDLIARLDKKELVVAAHCLEFVKGFQKIIKKIPGPDIGYNRYLIALFLRLEN